MQLAYRRPQEKASAVKGRPALVFLHAFPVDGRMWRGQLARLERAFDVVAIDFPGYGRTPADAGEMTMARLADDVVETLTGMENPPGRAIFVGCSMGGYVMFELWRRHREQVAGLVLCDTRAEADTEETRGKRKDQIAKIQNEGPEFFPRLMVGNVLSPDTRERQTDLVEEVRGWMSQAPAEVLVRTLEALAGRADSTDLLGGIDVPTLLVFGEHDQVTPRGAADRMLDRISGAELQILENAGHLSPLENPVAFNRHLEEWAIRHWG